MVMAALLVHSVEIWARVTDIFCRLLSSFWVHSTVDVHDILPVGLW
jgi:hypothetical protein